MALGLNEALVLQQLHYLLQRSRNERDGRRWVYNSFEQWQARFPWWSVRTVKSIFGTLEREGYLVTANYNRVATNRTKWYAIDYERVAELSTGAPSIVQDLHDASGNADMMHRAEVALSSIEQETTTEDNQQEELLFVGQVIEALEGVGVTPKVARELAAHDPDLAAAWLEVDTWRTARDPAALLITHIRGGEQPPRPRDPWALARRRRA